MFSIDLPFLLSKKALKKAGAILNFKNDTMTFLGYTVELVETSNGLYAIPLNAAKRYIDCKGKPELILQVTGLEELDDDELKRKLKHIHRNFSHPTVNKLQSLLKNSGVKDARTLNLLEEVLGECETCKFYKKVPSRPVVGLTRAMR